MNFQPKLIKIIFTDYPTFATLTGSIICMAVRIFYKYFKVESELANLVLLGLSIIAFIYFVYRFLYLKKLLSTGIECPGVIRKVWFYKDRGRVNFTYSYEGMDYTTGNAVMKNRKTRELVSGMNVTIIINEMNHKKAFIKDLYV